MTNENNGLLLYKQDMYNNLKLETSSNEVTESKQKTTNNTFILLIIFIPVLLIVIGFWLYRKVMSEEID
jgi:flagellar biogenesis protein FliO